jgi:hypothetical protein
MPFYLEGITPTGLTNITFSFRHDGILLGMNPMKVSFLNSPTASSPKARASVYVAPELRNDEIKCRTINVLNQFK